MLFTITLRLNSTRVYNEFPELRELEPENANRHVRRMQEEFFIQAKERSNQIEDKINSLPIELHSIALALHLMSFLNNKLLIQLLMEMGNIVYNFSSSEGRLLIETICNKGSDSEKVMEKRFVAKHIKPAVTFYESLPRLDKLDFAKWYEHPAYLNDITNLSFMFAARVAAMWSIDKKASESLAYFAYSSGYMFISRNITIKIEYGSTSLNYYLNLAEYLFNDLERNFVLGEQFESEALYIRGLIGFSRTLQENNLVSALDFATRFGNEHPHIFAIIGSRLSLCVTNERINLFKVAINSIWNKTVKWPEGLIGAILLAESKSNSNEFSLALQRFAPKLDLLKINS